MPNRPCPICNGERVVRYGVNSERLRRPIPCRCCDGTGIQLWPEPAAAHDWHVYHERQTRPLPVKRGPTERTRIAIRHGRYRDYCRECRVLGVVPASRLSWIRIRCEHRGHEEYVKGRRGRK